MFEGLEIYGNNHTEECNDQAGQGDEIKLLPLAFTGLALLAQPRKRGELLFMTGVIVIRNIMLNQVLADALKMFTEFWRKMFRPLLLVLIGQGVPLINRDHLQRSVT